MDNENEFFNMVNNHSDSMKRKRETSILENNNNFKSQNKKGKKGKKSIELKTIAIAAIVFSLSINAFLFDNSRRNAVSKHVETTYEDTNLPYPYIHGDGAYFYDHGNKIALSDGIKTYIKKLTDQGATLEDIYYYLSVNYDSYLVSAFKDEVKKSGQKLNLNDYANKVLFESRYNTEKDNSEVKKK